MKNYKCSTCGKSGVKLWSPIGANDPKICAECAEKRQSKLTYNEYVWEKNKRNAHLTGKKLPLPAWTVNEEGTIPSFKCRPFSEAKPNTLLTTSSMGLGTISG